MSTDYRIQELLAVEVSRHLIDEEVVFIGIGTGGPAFIRAVGIPLTACRLAQLSHAPNLVPMLGPLIDPDLDTLPSSLRDDYELVHWHSKAQIQEQEAMDAFAAKKKAEAIERYHHILDSIEEKYKEQSDKLTFEKRARIKQLVDSYGNDREVLNEALKDEFGFEYVE